MGLQGRYIPLFASAVYDQNEELVKAGLTPINLDSIMIGSSFRTPSRLSLLTVYAIGNGASDIVQKTLASYDYSCTKLAPIGPVVDIATCVVMKQIVRIQLSCIYDLLALT